MKKTILLAHPDATLHRFYLHGEDAFLVHEKTPIIAWSLQHDHYPLPITMQGEEFDSDHVIHALADKDGNYYDRRCWYECEKDIKMQLVHRRSQELLKKEEFERVLDLD